jgi:recombination protein RecT
VAGNVATTSSAPAPRPSQVIAHVLNQYRPVIRKLLAGTTTSAETLVAWIANACRINPKLWECEPETVLGAALRCAQVNLAPNDGNSLCWIIPYGRSATWQLGYGGVLELARRAAPGVMFDGSAVYPGDEFDIDLGNVDKPLTYRPAFARHATDGRRRARQSRDAYAWWVRARYPDGRTHVHALDRAGVEYHRAFSKQPDGDAWRKSYDAMALKSTVLEMRRWLPASAALATAIAGDGVVVDVRDIDPTDPALPAGSSSTFDDDEVDEQWVADAQAADT